MIEVEEVRGVTVLALQAQGRDENGRSGMFTSALLARVGGRTVAL